MKKRVSNARAPSARRTSAPRGGRRTHAHRVSHAGAGAGSRAASRAGSHSGSGTGPGGPRVLELPAECTLSSAETLKMRLTELLRSVKPITIDVRGVRRIDTGTMQLLAAFARDRHASELRLHLTGESGVFEEAVRLLGLAELLSPPAGAAPRA